MSHDMSRHVTVTLSAEQIGRLFLGRAHTFEVIDSPVPQGSFVLDSVLVESDNGKCRLTYSEWEEDTQNQGKILVSEYAIELEIGELLTYATYSVSFPADQRGSVSLLDQLKQDAENDFMLCARLLGRSVRRDLVIDEELPAPSASERFH